MHSFIDASRHACGPFLAPSVEFNRDRRDRSPSIMPGSRGALSARAGSKATALLWILSLHPTHPAKDRLNLPTHMSRALYITRISVGLVPGRTCVRFRQCLAASGVSPPSYKGAATARSLLTHSHPCIHIHTYTYMITIRLREASVSYLRVLAPLRKKREGEAIELLTGVTDGGDMNAHSSSRHCIGTCRCGYAPSARLESVLGYGCRGRLSCAAAEPLRTLGCARRVDPRAQRIASGRWLPSWSWVDALRSRAVRPLTREKSWSSTTLRQEGVRQGARRRKCSSLRRE